MKPDHLISFLGNTAPDPGGYENLFRYFVEGFQRYRSPLGALPRYPGLPSFAGALCDRMEGFARFAPAVAAWLHGGRPVNIHTDTGTVDLVRLLSDGLAAGTDPASPEYWGAIGHRDQRIVEAADIALAIWLAKDSVWAELPPAVRNNVETWLLGVNGKRTADNNWHLFVVLVNAALAGLDEAHDPHEMAGRYEHFKSFYRGDGWFSDGAVDKFDYYNAWGIHYPLHWVRAMDPSFDAGFLAAASRDFATTYRNFFGPCGFPMMGRSACYRMAAPAPLIQTAIAGDGGVTVGEARRALDVTWQWFIQHGALDRGTCTQGYGRADPRILDNYSGPASPLWSLRSLTAAFAQPATSAFWQSRGEALPVELGDFDFTIPATGWRLQGCQAEHDVRLHLPDALPDSATKLQPYQLHRRMRDLVKSKPSRPDNTAAKYRRAVYGSKDPFCGFG